MAARHGQVSDHLLELPAGVQVRSRARAAGGASARLLNLMASASLLVEWGQPWHSLPSRGWPGHMGTVTARLCLCHPWVSCWLPGGCPVRLLGATECSKPPTPTVSFLLCWGSQGISAVLSREKREEGGREALPPPSCRGKPKSPRVLGSPRSLGGLSPQAVPSSSAPLPL